MSDNYSTYRAKAGAAIEVLQKYYRPSLGVYVDSTPRWWQSATALEALIDYMTRTKSKAYYDIIETTFLNAPHSQRVPGFINAYYDDECWWAITWIKAYDFTGDEKYLRMAQSIFADVTSGWDTETCGGGLWWKKPAEYKAAIQNELFLVVATRLHQRTGGGDHGPYLEWAKKEWQWFDGSGMINASNLVNNGLNRDCKNDGGPTWTYNQGVILGGLVELFRITGDRRLLDKARAIAGAAIATLRYPNEGILRESCEPAGNCDGDQESFKGLFVRYLAYLYAHLPAADKSRGEYRRFLTTNADSVWARDKSAANEFGLKWVGPFKTVTVPTQTAALDVFNASIPFDPPQ